MFLDTRARAVTSAPNPQQFVDIQITPLIDGQYSKRTRATSRRKTRT
jgi:hypothetical protein